MYAVLLHVGLVAAVILSFGLWQKLRHQSDVNAKAIKNQKRKSKQSEAKLQSFLSAIHASPNGVVVLDQHYRIEWCNQTAAHLLGLNAERDLGQHLIHLVRDPAVVDYFARKDWGHEVRFERFALQLHPYQNQALLLVRDVTEIERADKMRQDFVANVSHEIKTPLTVLSGFIETLQSLELPQQEQKKYLDLMQAQSQRLKALVDDLLILSKLDEMAKPQLERLDVATILAVCEQEARALAQTLQLDLTFSFQIEGETELVANTTEVHSAFTNLITNAVRYTPSGGRVEVTWQSRTLSVTDTGVGIAQEHLARITERFYRVDQSRARDPSEQTGTGLGLAIVKHVAQRHGAELLIDSTLGVGSTFKLVF
jgi:two-component system phosphate regulon sensor histidine kinase PhoR